ncbi:hypothetical protein D3C84_620100 [compost metagenome]
MRFAHGGGEQFSHFIHAPGDFHAASTAAKGSLDGNWQAVLFGKGQYFGGAFDRARRTGYQRRPDQLGNFPRLDFVAEHVDGLRVGTDPDQPCVDHRPGEVGPFRQKTIAGVHGIGAAAFGDGDQFADIQVGLGRALAIQRVGFVGLAHVQGVDVRVGIDRDRLHAIVAAGAGDADGNFTTVGNQ